MIRSLLKYLLIGLLFAAAPENHAPNALAADPSAPPAIPAPHSSDPANPGTPATPAPAGVPEKFNSPRATMFTFLEAINRVRQGDPQAWADVAACIDWSDAGIDPSSQEANILARDLWGTLNHIRLVQPEELPDASQLQPGVDSFTYFPRPFLQEDERILEQIDIHGQRIALARMPDGQWKFSAQTIQGISQLYNALKPLARQVDIDENLLAGEPWLRTLMPQTLKAGRTLGLEYWQWIFLAIVILAGLGIDYAVRLILRPVLSRLVARFQTKVAPDKIARAATPLGLLAAGWFWQASIRLLGLSAAEAVLLTSARLITVLASTWTAWRVIDLISEVLELKAAQTENKFDDVLIPLLRKVLKVLVVIFGVIYAAQNLNISIGPMLASLGIGGLAFAFAAKDTIENIFGSIAVLLDRPFEVGDYVKIDQIEGSVEEIGFRSTRLRTPYDSQITMPNATLVRATVDNFGRRTYRRYKADLGIQYDTPVEKILAFTEGIRELIRTHPYTRKDQYHVWFQQFGASSLDIQLIVFFLVPDYATEMRERERLLLDVFRLADRLGVQFAFPTQTIHLQQQAAASTAPEAPQPPPSDADDHRGQKQGIHMAHQLTESRAWRREKPGPVVFTQGPTPLDDNRH